MAQTIKLKRSATQGAAPTTSNLALGEVAINTYDGKMYIKKDDGTESIVEIGSSALSDSFKLYEYSVSSSQTTFSGSDDNSNTLAYNTGSPPYVQVFLNGVLLDWSTDYTATNGTSVVLNTAAASGDLIQIAAYTSTVVSSTSLAFDDNNKLLLGTSSDLELFHDGSNSIINDAGTGNLKFQISGSDIYSVTTDGIVLANGLDVEASEFVGDIRGAVLFKAQAGEALSKGDVVYISGISGNTTVVSKADADDASKMPAFGVVANTASSGNPVDIYTNGILSGINTGSFNIGDELYVSTTAGVLTNSAPTGESAKLQKIAKVTRSDSSAGSIFITGAGRTNAVPNLDDGDIFIGNSSNQAVTATLDTSIVPENGDLYFTTDRVDTHLNQSTASSGEYLKWNGSDYEWATVPAGYTDSDARAAVSVTQNSEGTAALTYSSSTGVFSYTPPDLSGYLTSYTESDTLDSVTGRGNTTSNSITVANATVTGNLTVQGTTTTLDTATLNVEDKNITLNYSTGDSSGSANGAGITIQDAVNASTDATILWNANDDVFDFSHGVGINGNLEAGDGNNISMGSLSPGQLRVMGSGYQGAIALNADAMHIYHNSASRDIVFGTNETAQLRMDTAGNLDFLDGYIEKHNSELNGYIVGGYNSIGTNNSKTNPIYAIGNAYIPSSETSTTNFYGIGFTRARGSSASYLAALNWTLNTGWGLYTSQGGVARIFLDASNGDVNWTGNLAHNGTVVMDSSRDLKNIPLAQIGSITALNSYGTLQVNQSANNDESGIGILSASAGRSMRLWVDESDSYINSGNGGSGNLILNEAITVSNVGAVTGIRNITPDADDTYNLGASGTRWANVYTDGLTARQSTFTITDTTANSSVNAVVLDYNLSGTDALTADRTKKGLFIDVDSSATGGTTADEHRIHGLSVDVRATGDSDLLYGTYSYAESQHSAGQISQVTGVLGYAVADDTGTGHTSTIIGVQGLAYGYNTGTGGTSTYHGLYGKSLLSTANDKNTSAATGVYGEVEIDDAGQAQTLTNAYAFQAQIDDDSAGNVTVTNGYLFYGNYAGTQPTNAYGVYIADAVDSYFGGGDVTGIADLTTTGQLNPQTIYVKSNTYTTTSDIALTSNAVIKSGNSLRLISGSSDAIYFAAVSNNSPTTGWSSSTITNLGRFAANGNFDVYELGDLTSPLTDDLRLNGYGVIGNRSSPVYLTNAGTGGVQINADGGHGTANRVAFFDQGGITFDEPLSLTSTGNPLTLNAVVFNNTEYTGYYTGGTGTLAFDENFYSDTGYGAGTYDPASVFTGGNGGGLLIKNEDGWGAVFTTQNTRWASANWDNLTIDGNQVWHAGNDGSASGLDADTVDGIQGSNILTLSGSQTITGTKTFSASSGNIFLLNDTNATNATNANIYFYFQAQGSNLGYVGYGTSSNSYLYLSNGSHGGIYLNSSTDTNTVINGNTVWHAGNDGAGSGLDADTLDGIQGANFLRSDTGDTMSGSFTATGEVNAYSGAIDLRSDGIYFESGDHCITWNDGKGNFNIRVGHSPSEIVTEDGYVSQIEWSQSSGWMQINASSASRSVGNATSFNKIWQYTFSTGEFSSPGDLVAYSSDSRLKLNKILIQSPIEKIKSIAGYTFDWDIEKCDALDFTPGSVHEHGVIAQEIQKVIPDAVVTAPFDRDDEGNSKSGEEYLTVKYDRIIPLLIEAVKEQQKQIEEQQRQIKKLEDKLA